jgi:hypothetical protein
LSDETGTSSDSELKRVKDRLNPKNLSRRHQRLLLSAGHSSAASFNGYDRLRGNAVGWQLQKTAPRPS